MQVGKISEQFRRYELFGGETFEKEGFAFTYVIKYVW